MKKCPYCAEEIQNDAAKCKHCGEYFSIGGWLLFFSICLGVLTPLFVLFKVWGVFTQKIFRGDDFNLWAIGWIAFAVYCGVAGFQLLTKKTGAAKVARGCLWVGLIGSYIWVWLVYDAAQDKKDIFEKPIFEQVVGDAIRVTLFFGIWYPFLRFSKRVAALFPETEPQK